MRNVRRNVWAAVALLVMASCASTQSAWSSLDVGGNPEVVALALFGSFVIVEEAAANLAENPATPPEVRQALIEADAQAVPVMRQLRPLAEHITELRRIGADPERVTEAIAELNSVMSIAAPLVQRLSNLVRGIS